MIASMYSHIMIPLSGYTDKLSLRAGETIAAKVSSDVDTPYRAELVRIRSGDPNPDGPGVILEPVPSAIDGDYESRFQDVCLGSHLIAPLTGTLPDTFTVSANIWPTTPQKGRQGIVTLIDAAGKSILGLGLGDGGALEFTLGDQAVVLDSPLSSRRWHSVWATVDRDAGTVSLGVIRLDTGFSVRSDPLAIDIAAAMPTHILVAARNAEDALSHFNGKIEVPQITDGGGDVMVGWDFIADMAALSAPSVGDSCGDAKLVNAPVRAMTGSTWDGSEMNWHNAPDQYGAIHFHDDDIEDCAWETDFTFTAPDNLPSGAYGFRLTSGDDWDVLPFFVCPPKGTQTADVCVVIPTFTYVIYANQARADFGQHWRDRAQSWGAYPYNPADHPGFGLSTYNDHHDGSGIGHTTWHRPILNLRPGYHVFGDDASGSGLRHFPADLHLLAWLDAKDIAYDVLTDWELHHEGAAVLAPYKTVLTGSHPEYHTQGSLDAFQGYRDGGGKLIYLGGNGFYWRIALHRDKDGLIEVRRAEGGLRAWAADPGEYYHAFDGQYGGLWRRNGRPPNALTGVGYTCQGDFEGTYYRRTDASYEPDVDWIFDGVDGGVIGDFGYCGGGAAGYELDRADHDLGTPETAVVVARSENHPAHFVLPPEEWLTHVKTLAGDPPEVLIHADMLYAETPGGGAIFSTGSITFCGSLPWNDFNNNVSRILENVVRRFTQ